MQNHEIAFKLGVVMIFFLKIAKLAKQAGMRAGEHLQTVLTKVLD